MSSKDPVFDAIIIAFFSGGACLVSGIASFIKKRRVADVAIAGATAAQGLVELEGFAWNSTPPVKNLLNQDCAYRYFAVEEYVKTKNSSHWAVRWKHQTLYMSLIEQAR